MFYLEVFVGVDWVVVVLWMMDFVVIGCFGVLLCFDVFDDFFYVLYVWFVCDEYGVGCFDDD